MSISKCVVMVCLFMFGGLVQSFPSADTEMQYPLNSLIHAGSLFPLGGTLPTARVHHTITAIKDYLIVYGGYSENGDFLGDINIYYTVNQKWSGPILRKECCNLNDQEIDTTGFELEDSFLLPNIRTSFQGDIPLNRAEHTVSAIDTKMFLFGGLTKEYSYMNDVYSFDVNTLRWTQMVHENNIVPVPRAGHSMVTNSIDTLYIFGGRSYKNHRRRNTYPKHGANGLYNVADVYTEQNITVQNTVGLNDVWSYFIPTNKWTCLTTNARAQSADFSYVHTTPPVRQYAATAYQNDKIYMFGGLDPLSNVTYNDVWVFHVKLMTWEQLFSGNSKSNFGFVPPPLYHAHILPLPTGTVDANSTTIDGFLLYGGMSNAGACSGTSCKPLETVLGQVYQFRFTEGIWVAPRSVSGDSWDEESYYVNSTAIWHYARLNTVKGNEMNEGSNTGKLLKPFAMEKIVYLPERRLFYEFGGLQYSASGEGLNGELDTVTHTSDVFSDTQNTVFLESGGEMGQPLWDLNTDEQLRDRLEVPTNRAVWSFTDSFLFHSTAAQNTHKVKFQRVLRVYSWSFEDIVLIQENFI